MRTTDFLHIHHTTQVCGSCTHWVASRIHDNGRFYCPPDTEGMCGQQPRSGQISLLSAESTCHGWQMWSRCEASR